MASSFRSDTKFNVAPWISGVLGGSASTILLYPLDLVKVRWQVKEDPTATISLKGVKLPKQRRSIISTIRGVVKHEGVAGLYQGLTPALVGSALSWGGYFFLYEGIKLRMVDGKRQRADVTNESKNASPPNGDVRLAPLDNFVAACMAGAVMVVCTNPIWLIKTRMQLQLKRVEAQHVITSSSSNETIKPPYKNMVDAARTIVREEGLLALYKGAAPAMMLTSHGGVQFVTYEYLKSNFGTYTKAKRSAGDGGKDRDSILHQLQNSMGYLTMGAVSKIIASTTTYPLQVIKSRLQQRSQNAELSSTGKIQIVKREYAGVIDCVTRIWKIEGVIGFFKGCMPNAIRVAPSSAITLVVYEGVMAMLSDTYSFR